MAVRSRQALTAAMVGAGQRGFHVYGELARASGDIRFVAVVDPDPERRRRFGERHGIEAGRWFGSTGELAAAQLDLDAWFVASPDRDHLDAARSAIASGSAVFLEKPVASTPADVAELVTLAASSGSLVHVAHVLRYTPFFQVLHRTLWSGAIGDIVTVEHRENVAAFHMAHSFVRGNWSRAADSTPMIVAKCCHDFDILQWNLPSPVARITSFGSLMHFTPAAAPPGAKDRCTDGCPVEHCPFDARRIYLDPAVRGWPVHVITDDLSEEGRLRSLREGPYGRCVYSAGSDVVDHQVVAMELENGGSVTLTMHGHSHEEERTMRYDGTKGTLRAVFGRRQVIEVVDHHGGPARRVPIPAAASGHGGGDAGAVARFVDAVRGGTPSSTAIAESLESHLLAFAAEEARRTGTVVDMDLYRSRFS
jgi:predicted dehydrogenase